ncbi:TIGR03667 family PPOX class F420-dependent oxidoreductase [Mumia sp. DW29H23]|uniref:TIGR03667 family PPOX class F420-dependent oxidoreductase n=1 Tax=Mumia sp. DW29H23 TaxID=3421241 RepID=UPI003D68CC28
MTNDVTTLSAGVRERLGSEYVVWLTTVNAAGEPIPTPVWFVWVDDEVWIRSQPAGAKLEHVAANPHVALNLNADRTGGDVVVLNGTGSVETVMSDAVWDAYVQKYADQISGLGFTPDSFAASYSVPLRVRVDRVRAW